MFGQIGGQTTLDLLSVNKAKQTGILRVPLESAKKTRAALALINSYQGIPAVFEVIHSSTQLSSLTETFIEV